MVPSVRIVHGILCKPKQQTEASQWGRTMSANRSNGAWGNERRYCLAVRAALMLKSDTGVSAPYGLCTSNDLSKQPTIRW
mmetsp:Transcript_14699/g.23159  ORF Transcript_14699/g.23159 Transcript_14699/m.23159 type:complete len:80 (+) Transcript_14699:1166-1405(+)